MRKLYLLTFLLYFNRVNAQSGDSYWSIGVNPLSLIESTPSIGPNVAYRFSPRIELWAEASYIFSNFYADDAWKNLKGYRFLFQPRLYTGRAKTFFIALEFRLKHFTYNTTDVFINKSTADTLNDYAYKGVQTQAGGAIVFGRQLLLSERHQLFLELTAGVGSKQRYIKRKNVPDGYDVYFVRGGSAFAPQYNVSDGNVPYMPLGLRLTWKLNNNGVRVERISRH